MRQVYFRLDRQHIQLPVVRGTEEAREVVWLPARYHAVLTVLKNPVYAGACAYRRSKTVVRLEDGRKKVRRGAKLLAQYPGPHTIRYQCPGHLFNRDRASCVMFGGLRADRLVSEQLLQSLAPFGIDGDAVNAAGGAFGLAGRLERSVHRRLSRRGRRSEHARNLERTVDLRPVNDATVFRYSWAARL